MPVTKRPITAKKTTRRKVSARAKTRAPRQTSAFAPQVARTTVSAPHHELTLMREKRLALWSGVAFFMVIIISVWVVTFQRNVQSHVPVTRESEVEIDELLENLNRTFREVKSGLSDLQGVVGEEHVAVSSPRVNEEDVILLQNRLSEIEQRLELERFLYRFNTELQQQARAATP